jgi:hypothetical protein
MKGKLSLSIPHKYNSSIFSYPEQRSIVRQDERPACFYIVLSGLAIVTYKRVTDGNIESLDILNRGCTFGVSL